MVQPSFNTSIVFLILAIIFGAIVGAFVVGTLFSFFGIGNGVLIGALLGAVGTGVYGGILKASADDGESDTSSSDTEQKQ
jgi:uncharacterized protein YcfJ